MNAQDFMTPSPVTVNLRTTVAEAWDLMREMDIRHLPVVDADGALVGMLSDRDLARLDIGRLVESEGAETLRRELGTPVMKVMSADVIAVDPEAGLDEIIELLVEQRVGAVPVIRPESREVVGIVSYVDVLRALQDVLEDEAATDVE